MRLLIACLFALPASAHAWSLVVPTSAEAPCVQYDHHQVAVSVTPDAARATTEVRFRSLEDGPAQVLIPQLAAGATGVWLDGEKLVLDLLDAPAATDRIVSLGLSRVRPTLLLAAHRPLQAKRVELAAGPHTLRVEAPVAVDWAAPTPRILVPLRTLGTACHRVPAQATVEIETDTPLGAAFTPYHDARVERPGPRRAVVHVSSGDAQRDDLHIYLAQAEDDVAANVVSFRGQACGQDAEPGYLLVAAGPTTTEAADAVAKDVVLVVDRSGSMEGEKIAQVRRALGAILAALGPDDRFDVVSFAGGVDPVFGRLTDVDPDSRRRAADVVENLRADGSTDIHSALVEAFSELNQGDHARPRVVVFLTDGQPTAGETDTDAILSAVAGANEIGARLFAFGVGHDVNTRLLDSLSDQTGTVARYIQPGADIDTVLVEFYRDIQAPVVTGVSLDAVGVQIQDVLPRALPDLYIGTQLLAAARYADARDARLELAGQGARGDAAYAVRGPVLRYGEAHPWLPRLWASRRMAELLYDARQGGDEAHADEIQALAWRYGFVTRFTQFRVADDGSVEAGYRAPTAEEVGEEAVGTSSDINSMSRNDNAGGYSGEGGPVAMVQALDRTFVHDHEYWLDTTVPAAPAEVLDVRLGGAAWRDLLDAGAGAYLAVGRNVIFQWRCRTVRVTDPTLVDEAPDVDALPADLVGPGPGPQAMGRVPADGAERERDASCAAADAPGLWPLWGLLLLGVPRRRAT